MSNPDFLSISMIINARKRNYTFRVGDQVLDAVTVSNETRFPNHKKEKPNCIVKGLRQLSELNILMP